MAEHPTAPAPRDDDAERRRAIADDFLRSHAAGDLAARIDEDVELFRRAMQDRGVKVDRANAWEVAMRKAIATEQDGGNADLAAEFEAAVSRWELGAPVRDLSVDESLTRASAALLDAFPTVTFDVNHREDAWGRWLMLEWVDGPTERAVDNVATHYIGVHTEDDGPVRYAFYGLSTWRDYSAKAMAWAEQAWAAGVTRDPEDAGFVVGLPEGATTMTIEGHDVSIDFDPPLERLIGRLLDDTNL